MGSPTLSTVGLGQLLVVERSGQIVCHDIGSTVALVGYCPAEGRGAMVHIVLPEGNDAEHAPRYANLAPSALLKALGCSVGQARFAYVGGSHVLHTQGGADWSDLGARNVLAVDQALKDLGADALQTDIGGAYGRSLSLDVASGTVTVSSFTLGSRLLCNLLSQQEAA